MATKNWRVEKSPFLDKKGNEVTLVYTPVTAETDFTENGFAKGVEDLEFLRDSNKQEFSQMILGNNSLVTLSDSKFYSGKKTFNNHLQEQFDNHTLKNSGTLAGLILAETPSQAERSILSKHRNAQVAAFEINEVFDESIRNSDTSKAYNAAADAVKKYHKQTDKMEEMGSEDYVLERLNKLTDPHQIAFIYSFGGEDLSKIANSYRNHWGRNALDTVEKKYGAANFLATNIQVASQLAVGQKHSLELLAEAEGAEMGRASSDKERTSIGLKYEKAKEDIANQYQNAGSDANYKVREFTGNAYDAILAKRDRESAEANQSN